MTNYQWEKTLGRVFRCESADYSGFVNILGIPYAYKVVEGMPEENLLLEIVDFKENELYVRVLADSKGEMKYV